MFPDGAEDSSVLLSRMRDAAARGHLVKAIAIGRSMSAAPWTSAAAAEVTIELAWLSFQTGAGRVGLHDADQAIAACNRLGDRATEARALAVRALIELELGQGEAAAEQALGALQLAETSGSEAALGWALNMVGVVFWYCQQHARAIELLKEAVAVARGIGDDLLAGLCLVNLAGAQQAAARGSASDASAATWFTRSLETSRAAVTLLEREGELAQRIVCLLNLTVARLFRSEIAEAEALLVEVDALPPVEGHRVQLFRDEVAIELLLASGHHATALPQIKRLLAAAEEIEQFESVLNSVRMLADAYEHLGDLGAALACLKRRHLMEGRICAERIQQRARMAEIVLGLKRLEAEVADITREREAIARSLTAVSRRADDLAEDTRRDPLTGISNRRHLDEILAATPDDDLAIAMIDVDRFKSINDRFSHATGDFVLRRIAAALRDCSRAGDLVARFGGEEFMVVMFGADIDLGRRVCRRLRLAIRALAWEHLPPSFTVTISVGLASRAETSDVDELVALADRRLYAAKRAGRDRTLSRGGEHRRHGMHRSGTPPTCDAAPTRHPALNLRNGFSTSTLADIPAG